MSDGRSSGSTLHRTAEQFHILVDSVEEYAIYMLDSTGNVVTWNTGAQKIKGYRADEIIGKNFACFYTAEDVAADKPQRNLREAARKGHIRDLGPRVRKDGSIFQAEIVLTVLRDNAGNVRGYSKVTRDITDQIRSREFEAEKIAAEKANKAKDDILAALSHELRTPLTPALAAAAYLENNASKLPSEFAEDVKIIKRNVQLQARLIDDLLDLTRITRVASYNSAWNPLTQTPLSGTQSRSLIQPSQQRS
jgi:PAS domain S-box-containing protein